MTSTTFGRRSPRDLKFTGADPWAPKERVPVDGRLGGDTRTPWAATPRVRPAPQPEPDVEDCDDDDASPAWWSHVSFTAMVTMTTVFAVLFSLWWSNLYQTLHNDIRYFGPFTSEKSVKITHMGCRTILVTHWCEVHYATPVVTNGEEKGLVYRSRVYGFSFMPWGKTFHFHPAKTAQGYFTFSGTAYSSILNRIITFGVVALLLGIAMLMGTFYMLTGRYREGERDVWA